MSRFPARSPSDPPPPPPLPRAAGPDSLTLAKRRLLEAGQDVRPLTSTIHRHPYASAAAALVAGLLVSRMPAVRKVAGLAAAWGLKRAVRQYLAGR